MTERRRDTTYLEKPELHVSKCQKNQGLKKQGFMLPKSSSLTLPPNFITPVLSYWLKQLKKWVIKYNPYLYPLFNFYSPHSQFALALPALYLQCLLSPFNYYHFFSCCLHAVKLYFPYVPTEPENPSYSASADRWTTVYVVIMPSSHNPMSLSPYHLLTRSFFFPT